MNIEELRQKLINEIFEELELNECEFVAENLFELINKAFKEIKEEL